MNRNHRILSTTEFEDAADYARACQVKYEDIRYRVERQQQVVLDCAENLSGLVAAHAWENAETPAVAREARQLCAEAAEDYESEQQLLHALETAATNAREETASAGRRTFGILGGIVSSQIGSADKDAVFDNTVAA